MLMLGFFTVPVSLEFLAETYEQIHNELENIIIFFPKLKFVIPLKRAFYLLSHKNNRYG